MIYSIVFTVSLATLFYEVVLARFFSVTHWHHFAFLIISFALFGFTASGIFLNLLDKKVSTIVKKKSIETFLTHSLVLFSLSQMASYFIINSIQPDFFRLALEIKQIFFFVINFLSLSVPFFFSGLITAASYAFYSQKSDRIYFATMSGSAFGALMPLFTISFFHVEGAILFAGLLPLGLCVFFYHHPLKRFIPLLATAVFILLFLFSPDIILIRQSPYKKLNYYNQIPDTEVTLVDESVKGRIHLIESPYIRSVKGLSLKYSGLLPRQKAILKDGDFETILYFQQEETDVEGSFIPFITCYAAYHFLQADGIQDMNVLVIQSGGGLAVYMALNLPSVAHVTLLEEIPETANLIQKHYDSPKLTVVNTEARVFLSASKEKYDVIHIDKTGSSLPGLSSLYPEYLFTAEAFQSYFFHLKGNGIIVTSRKLLMPPADSLKMFNTITAALNPLTDNQACDHLLIFRNYDTYTLLCYKTPLTQVNYDPVLDFIKNRGFDPVYHPAMKIEEANQFNLLSEPVYFNSIQALREKEGFENQYIFNIYPQDDAHPFFNQFLKWEKMDEVLQKADSQFYSILLSGEVAVLIIFVVAFFIAFILLFLPVALTFRKVPRFSFFYLCIGAGFMFFEIGFINELTFLLSDPVVAFSIVLSAILFSSGLGGLLSSKIQLEKLRFILLVVFVLGTALFFSLNPLIHLCLKLDFIFRVVIAFLLVFPVAFLLGFPFPVVMKNALEKTGQRAYAWAANGGASVLTSILATQISLSINLPSLFLFGGIVYLLALLSFHYNIH